MEENEQWWAFRRGLDDGRIIFVVSQMYNAKITIGTGEQTFDEEWAYQTITEAVEAAAAWNPDEERDAPGQWIRHLPSGRRQ